MNRRQLFPLILLVAVVGGLGLYLYQRRAESWQAPDTRLGQKLIDDFPLNDVNQLSLKGADAEVNLAKNDEVWTVQERGDYPANFSEVSGVLRKFWEMTVTQPQNASAAQLPRFGLVPPKDATGTNAGTLVEFKGKGGKVLHTVLLGKQHIRESQGGGSPFGGGGWPDGRYVMVGSDPKTVSLVDDPLSNLEPKPANWLNKDFFKIEKIRAVSVNDGTNGWSIARGTESGSWSLLEPNEGEELDSSKVSSVGNAFSYPSFSDVAAGPMQADAAALERPVTAVIETFEDFKYTINVNSNAPNGDYYLRLSVAAGLPTERTPGTDEKPEDKEKLDKEFQEKIDRQKEKLKREQSYENWTYIVSKWTVDPILKQRHELLAEKKEEVKTEEKTEVEESKEDPPAESGAPLDTETKSETRSESGSSEESAKNQ